MAINIPIKSVDMPRHLAAFVFTDPTADDRARLEVYTGWVLVDYTAGGSLIGDNVVTFVPLRKNVVQEYQDGDLLDFTLTATVSAAAV